MTDYGVPNASLADPASSRAALARAAAEPEPARTAWLGRAHRLSPDDPTITFMVASAVLATDPAQANALLSRLLEMHPRFRDASIALAASELRLGRPEAAAARLGALLARSAPPPGDAFRTLVDAVCRAVTMPGWIGLGGGALELAASGRPEVTLDGLPLPLPGPMPRDPRAAGGGFAGRIELPAHWLSAGRLDAAVDGRALLGSPVDLACLRATEGFVDVGPDGGLVGWAWLPGDPDHPAPLVVRIGGAVHRILAEDEALAPAAGHVLDRRRGFRVAPNMLHSDGLREIPELRVYGADGRELAGSPLRPGREVAAARAAAARLGRTDQPTGPDPGPDPWRPLDAGLLGALSPVERTAAAPSRDVDIVIPVWRGADDLAACLASLAGSLPPRARIVVVDDGSSDAALRTLLDTLAEPIVVLRHAANQGFPAAANTGMRQALRDGRDVLLLNPDTLLPPGAVVRLARAAYAAAHVGSATPLTNDGTITSYAPAADIAGPARVGRLDALVRKANGDGVVELPTAVGFCLFIRNDCLAATGLFRDDVFAQGYGEENDWSLRARHLGWRHVAATGVFVAHLGGRSFGGVRADLMARNARQLNRLHPGYDALIRDFVARDPLAPARRAVDRARWAAGRQRRGAVLLVSHDQGGGVARSVADRSAAIRAEGRRPVVLFPMPGGVGLADDTGETYPDLRFALPGEHGAFAALLAAERPQRVELHHFIGHQFDPGELARQLAVPLDVVIHDSALWCPRVTLTDATQRYCGEPADVSVCVACIRDLGGRLREDIAVPVLRGRSRGWLQAARRVVVSCDDAARRIERQFPGVHPVVEPWEDDASLRRAMVGQGATAGKRVEAAGDTRIVVVGAIGPEKGYQVLLDCARDAERRRLALEFVVVGHTTDDARLLETGRVFVTGRFAEADAVPLVAAQHGRFGFVPSVVPETWCYALSALWGGGLRVACFALGAQAERVARSGAGAVLPLGLPAARVNDLLLTLAAG